MRKGFTLILATVALSFLAVTAMAKGPTIAEVPDVYISQNTTAAGVADVSASANIFRFSNALNLWDYITTGSEEAETSDKVYWGYGIKDADYSTKQASGSFLTGAAAHYQIGSQSPLTGTQAASLNAQTLQTIQAAGALTFRNVRLSPLPEAGSYPAATKSPATLPGNVLDFQQATLFVTDKVTSESSDNIFLITVDGDVDKVSMSGPSWTNVRTFSSGTEAATGGGDYWLGSETELNTFTSTTPITMSKTASALIIRTNSWTGVGSLGAYCLFQPNVANEIPVAAGDLGKIYRMKANVLGSKATSNTNPAFYMALNGQTQGPGQGQLIYSEAPTATPNAGPTTTAKDYAAYLWPVNAGTFAPMVQVYNGSQTDTQFTVNLPITIDTINQADLTGGTELVKAGEGGTAFVAGTADGQWGTAGSASFSGIFGYTSSPTFTSSLSGTLLTLGITGTTVASSAGMVKYGSSNLFTTSAGKLVVVKVNANATAAVKTAQFRILVTRGNATPCFFIGNHITPSVFPVTRKDYCAVFASDMITAGAWSVGLEAISTEVGLSGGIQIHSVTVTEYPMP